MSKKTLTTVMGAALAGSLAGAGHAGENPFFVKELPGGYQQLAEAGKEQAGKEQKEMICGEGKCGAQMQKNPEMNCGAMKEQQQKKEAEQKKAMEGKCAGMKMDTPAPAQPPAPKTP
ncbi:HvfA family oxazolone/thioamide-modified RiPP metallophore [Candidatus Methylocalor cossyra]|uniref:Low-complexity protein n=1 Tax=Candidatus Methylocalor cossyra TaxID=3108543 RepID=A0ABM9NKE1_9GAMM